MAMKKNAPTVFTVGEVARILRIGRISAYQAIGRGDVPSIRIGRRILIPRMALEQMLIRPKLSDSISSSRR
jgi:excisionase family DNA binding protein